LLDFIPPWIYQTGNRERQLVPACENCAAWGSIKTIKTQAWQGFRPDPFSTVRRGEKKIRTL